MAAPELKKKKVMMNTNRLQTKHMVHCGHWFSVQLYHSDSEASF
jgi:hypothetical protein